MKMYIQNKNMMQNNMMGNQMMGNQMGMGMGMGMQQQPTGNMSYSGGFMGGAQSSQPKAAAPNFSSGNMGLTSSSQNKKEENKIDIDPFANL